MMLAYLKTYRHIWYNRRGTSYITENVHYQLMTNSNYYSVGVSSFLGIKSNTQNQQQHMLKLKVMPGVVLIKLLLLRSLSLV